MDHDVTSHDPSAAPTRGASLPQAYVELLSRLEDMDVYVHQITVHWPKSERHGLAADVRRQITQLHRLCAVAWKRKSKSGALFDLDVELHVLKTASFEFRVGNHARRPTIRSGGRVPAIATPRAGQGRAACFLQPGAAYP